MTSVLDVDSMKLIGVGGGYETRLVDPEEIAETRESAMIMMIKKLKGIRNEGGEASG